MNRDESTSLSDYYAEYNWFYMHAPFLALKAIAGVSRAAVGDVVLHYTVLGIAADALKDKSGERFGAFRAGYRRARQVPKPS